MEYIMPDRYEIVAKLRQALELLHYIYAYWLEGADANGTVDEYSDIDFWVDVDDDYEEQAYEAVENALSELAAIDYKYIMRHDHSKIRQRVYHLAGTCEYLMIDFCWQLHSRDKNETVLIEGNLIESAKIIFDKSNVVRFKPFNMEDYKESNSARYNNCLYRFSQHDRVLKYVHRGNYLEAYAFYNHYVLEPLINMLRLIYTPANADYYLIHISHHIPTSELEKLEYFTKISSLKDISVKTESAKQWFDELKGRVI